jgi:tripartite-type tricarboxylate transporter receptor subunit TctC
MILGQLILYKKEFEMRKFFIGAALAMAAVVAPAAEVVTFIWGWSLGDPMAQYSRSLIQEANQLQNKYKFVLDARPGAGGAIAARHVENTPNTILATSTAFFVRPNFYPADSHNPENFRVLMTQCALPMAVASSKYSSWQQVPQDRALNIGISGLGATSHLIAEQVRKKYPLLEPIPYKSTRDSMLDLAAGRLDLHVGFPGEIEPWVREGKMHALGVTGPRAAAGIPALNSQGFVGVDQVVNGHSLIVPKSIAPAVYAEWRDILLKAATARSVQTSYAVDHCSPSTLNDQQTQAWFVAQTQLWKKLSQGINITAK